MIGAEYRKYGVWVGAGLVILILVATFAYSLFFKGPLGTETPSGGEFPSGGGRTIGETGSALQNGAENPETTEGEPVQYLFQLHDKPVVSSVVFVRANRMYARLMEEGTGHIYEYDIADKKSYRISNTSVPKIQEAFWSTDGNTVAFRYEDGGVLKSAVAELATSTVEASFRKVSFLPFGIQSLALSLDGADIFYVLPGSAAGTASGVVAKRDGSSPRIVFTSKLPRWFVSWPAQNSVLVSSPWSENGGIVYRINPASGTQSVAYSTQDIFVGASGGPNGEVLVTDPISGRIALVTSGGALDLQIAHSWPILCAFTVASSTVACADIPLPGKNLFSAWSRGEYDFKSSFIRMELTSGFDQLLLDKASLGDKVFDVVNPALAPDASYATFKNRVDGLLWGVTI